MLADAATLRPRLGLRSHLLSQHLLFLLQSGVRSSLQMICLLAHHVGSVEQVVEFLHTWPAFLYTARQTRASILDDPLWPQALPVAELAE